MYHHQKYYLITEFSERGKAKRDIRGPPHGGTGGLIYAQIDSTSIAMW